MRRNFQRTLVSMISLCSWLCLVPCAQAQTPLHRQIDALIEAGIPDFNAKAAPLTSDAEFLRRIYLDLHGTIPNSDDARQFLANPSPNKREKLVDELLADPRFARHMQETFDVLLMERRPDKHVKSPQWHEFLRSSFQANKPYDQLVREILAADGLDDKTAGAAKFYLDRLGEPNDITKDVSRLFLGMNLQCAQCHDHPMVNAYKMKHYFGIYAFFNRSYVVADKAKKRTVFGEKAEGEVTFESVFVPKVVHKTGPQLPGGKAIEEKTFPKGKEYDVKPSKTAAGIPKFSRRDHLAPLLASAENLQFRRTAANRFWTMLMGRGIIHPVDFDHPENPPSHPQLIDLLADEFAEMKFDVKAFIKQIVFSKTYQRSSQMPDGKELPAEDRFAVAQLRPLSPEQLAWATMQATGLTDSQRLSLGKKANEAELHKALSRNIAQFARVFGGQAGDPADLGFQATLDQTLFLRNGNVIRSWLTPRSGSLIFRLNKAKNNDELADELFLSVLTRFPTSEEKADVAEFLKDRESNRQEALQELAWALLASAEFRFNH